MHGVTSKGRTQSNASHCRGRQNQLPWQSCHPDRGNAGGKMLFNSVISTKGARFMTMDISNFYLMTPLHHPEFIHVKLSNIPDEVIEEYNFREKATKNGSVYIKAKRGVYGPPQSRLLANKLLEKQLNKHGYQQSKLVPGLWKHDTRPIQFTLVVDDFRVKYKGKEHAQHLKNTLEKHYKLTCNWTGTRYIGSHWTGTAKNTKCICQCQTT